MYPMGQHRLSLKAGVWSTVGGLLGSSAAVLLFPTLSAATVAELGIAGAVGGMGLDSTQDLVLNAVDHSVSGYHAIFEKLQRDFELGPLQSWDDTARDHARVMDRIVRAGLANAADSRVMNVSSID